MNWLNFEMKTLTSDTFLGCDPIERGTWLCLNRYCAQQENYGVIKDCKDWGDRKWQQLCGITKEEAHRECPLWTWHNGSIEVWEYPVAQQMATQAKRKAGKRHGKKKGQKHVKKPPEEQKKKPKPRFVPPTLEEVKAYCEERTNGIDYIKWHDFYSAKGWMVGKNKMKDWKAAVRTWEQSKTKAPKPEESYAL
jgi:hypothetical protein